MYAIVAKHDRSSTKAVEAIGTGSAHDANMPIWMRLVNSRAGVAVAGEDRDPGCRIRGR